MTQIQPPPLRYAAWLRHVFDHPVEVDHGSDPSQGNGFAASDAEYAALITQTFSNCGTDLKNFSDAQVNRGLDYLINPSHSDFMVSLRDGALPIAAKLAAIESIHTLYRDCYAPRCTHAGSALWGSCFMFWDVCPLNFLAEHPQRTPLMQAILSVLQRTLALDSEPCQHAALHGLGHIACEEPQHVATLVDQFLERNKVSPELQQYAQQAREGMVQ